MKMDQPIGSEVYAPLFIRCTLGAYFVLAGLAKLDNVPGLISEIERFHILPKHLASLFGILLPYLEIIAGTLLVLGIWTTLAALMAAILLGCFIYAFGIFPSQSDLFNKDIILLGGALSVLYSGAGALSIDRFRRSAT